MPTEDHSSERSRQGLPQGGVDLSLDELAKGLATGTFSRGKALRLMGAALVGGALASLGIGEASADPPDPRGCKRNGKSCKNNSQCCSANCDSGTCADMPPPPPPPPQCTPPCIDNPFCLCEDVAPEVGGGTACVTCAASCGGCLTVSCDQCPVGTICISRGTFRFCGKPCSCLA
jgi:hypothetical protein